MAYDGIAWPGVKLAINVLSAQRGQHVRLLRMVEEQPKLYKRPTNVKRKEKETIAQYDAALKVLRDAERAMAAPAKRTRKRSDSA